MTPEQKAARDAIHKAVDEVSDLVPEGKLLAHAAIDMLFSLAANVERMAVALEKLEKLAPVRDIPGFGLRKG